MLLRFRLVLLVMIAVLFFQCQKEVSYAGSADPGQVVLPSPMTANLQGNVLDENGQPAAGVTIKVGAKITLTNASGYFRINDAPLDNNAALVTAEKAGYFKAFRTFGATSGTNQVQLKLIKKEMSGTVSGTTGGEISLAAGLKIALPAGGMVKASDNSSYSGTVNVYAAYIDPTAADIQNRIPGSFMANDKDGKRVLLSSYGMMTVELESTTGEKLQIKQGSTATLTSPIPAIAQASAPATIPLWYVDETTGLWQEEGMATKQGNNYIGTVKHFTYWNCDVPVQTITLSATFKTADGQPLVNASVSIKPKTGNYYGSAHGFTDSLGQIHGPVPANMTLTLQVMDGCGGAAYSKEIGPFSEKVDLGTISVPSTTPGLVTVKGKLTSCSAAAVTNGYAIVSIRNNVHFAKVDGNGNFSTNFVVCNTTGAEALVIGVDNAAQQQGNVTSQPVNSTTLDFGILSACGTASTEKIDYTIDGTNYLIGSADSLLSYRSDSSGTAANITHFMGAKAPNFIKFEINTTAQTPGTYRLTALSLQNFSQVSIVQPLNATLTSFATAPGQFYEGNFSGQFKDPANQTHTISCSFRVRRTF